MYDNYHLYIHYNITSPRDRRIKEAPESPLNCEISRNSCFLDFRDYIDVLGIQYTETLTFPSCIQGIVRVALSHMRLQYLAKWKSICRPNADFPSLPTPHANAICDAFKEALHLERHFRRSLKRPTTLRALGHYEVLISPS